MLCLSLVPVSCDTVFWCIGSAFVEKLIQHQKKKKNLYLSLLSVTLFGR